MIDDELAAFIEGPVMTVLAASDDRGRPVVARAVGVRHRPDDGVTLLVSREQWPDFVAQATPGGRIAATFSRPMDYRTFQLKGEVRDVAAPDAEDEQVAAQYLQAMSQGFTSIGVAQSLVDQWIVLNDLVRLRLSPSVVFAQTPGPGAGDMLEAAR